MNLEEAKANIGAEVELDESTKPYTFMHDDGNEHERISDTDDSKTYEIIDFDDLGNAILEISGYQISPRHLKLKPQNYKIHVPTEVESREAQELFFELGYEWMNSEKYIQHTDMPYIYSYSDAMKISMGWIRGDFESHKNKKITIQELRDMVSKKRMKEFEEKQNLVCSPISLEDISEQVKGMALKSIGVDLASGEDNTLRVTGTFQDFEPRKEMTWQDAFRAVADGKRVEFYNELCGQWWNISRLSATEAVRIEKFRIAPKYIYLHGNYTKEELLKEIGEME